MHTLPAKRPLSLIGPPTAVGIIWSRNDYGPVSCVEAASRRSLQPGRVDARPQKCSKLSRFFVMERVHEGHAFSRASGDQGSD